MLLNSSRAAVNETGALDRNYLRWRLDFHKPMVENRFKELIERASLFMMTEFTAAGVTELGCVLDFTNRAH